MQIRLADVAEFPVDLALFLSVPAFDGTPPAAAVIPAPPANPATQANPADSTATTSDNKSIRTVGPTFIQAR